MKRLFCTTLITLLLTGFMSEIVNTKQVKAEGESFQPTTIRGFNTFGKGMTLPNVKQLRGEYGVNAVRLQIHPRQWQQSRNVTMEEAWEAVLEQTEIGLEEAARQGIMSIIDLHSVPVNMSDKSPEFWGDENNLDVWIASWEDIVNRLEPYRDYIWGYDILNEPHNKEALPIRSQNWQDWTQQVVDAIRKLDTVTPVIIEPDPGALPRAFMENVEIDAGPGYEKKYQGDFPLIEDDRAIYSVHFYEPHIYTHQGIGVHNNQPITEQWDDQYTYPGIIEGVYWDKEKLRAEMQPVVAIQKKYNVPIYVGEFSAVRWAAGADQYIRDSIELFEEFGWSWTYHAYADWAGWDVDFNGQMTSDVNKEAARAIEPTDRELILKAYFNKNNYFAPPLNTPRPTENLLKNGDFQIDNNGDGVADYWTRNSDVNIMFEQVNEKPVQKVVANKVQGGLTQEWINVSDEHLYRLKAKIRVDEGTARFWTYFVDSTYKKTNPELQVIRDIPQTNGEFVTVELDFVAPEHAAKLSTRLWSITNKATFYVDQVELLDLGKSIVETAPKTNMMITGEQLSNGKYIAPVHIKLNVDTVGESTVADTVYRVAGENGGGWKSIPAEGITLNSAGNYIIGYYSKNIEGVQELAQSRLLELVAASTPYVPPTKEDEPVESAIPDEVDENENPIVPSVQFTDVAADHWALNDVKKAIELGLVKGYGDGTFRPSSEISREEIAVMLARVLNMDSSSAFGNSFSDKHNISNWAQNAIAQLSQAEIIQGYEDDTFRPKSSITRAELAVIVARALNLEASLWEEGKAFTDDHDIPNWSKAAVYQLKQLAIINGKPGNRFDPKATTTRAEAVIMLLRILGHKK